MKNTDLMVDIESFSGKKDKIILSIAARFFDIDTGKVAHPTFKRNISIDRSLSQGFSIDARTLKWWIQNNSKLLQKMMEADNMGYDPQEVMMDFIEFCGHGQKGYRIWARPPLYDLRALLDAFERYNLSEPWDFRGTRCVRTYASIFPGIEKEFEVKGDEHDPLVDVNKQIEYVCEIHKRIESLKSIAGHFQIPVSTHGAVCAHIS